MARVIVLDTNVGSELTKRKPQPRVLDWFARQAREDFWACSPVIMEQWYGAKRFLDMTGSRRLLEAYQRLHASFGDRVLTFDSRTATHCGELRAERDASGRPIGLADAMIAAICIVNGATLATRNVRDFDGLDLKLVNPFEAAG